MAKDENYLLHKGHRYYWLQDYKKAISYYNKAIAINPDSNTAWFCKGCSHFGLEQFKRTIHCYQRLKLHCTNKKMLAYLRWLASICRKGRKARVIPIEYLKKMEPHDPAEGWVLEGNFLTEVGKYKKALRAFETAIRIAKGAQQWDWPWLQKGELLYRFRRYDQALNCFNRVIRMKLDYNKSFAWGMKGVIYDSLRDMKKAEACYKKAFGL